jgi:hypothetical protein
MLLRVWLVRTEMGGEGDQRLENRRTDLQEAGAKKVCGSCHGVRIGGAKGTGKCYTPNGLPSRLEISPFPRQFDERKLSSSASCTQRQAVPDAGLQRGSVLLQAVSSSGLPQVNVVSRANGPVSGDGKSRTTQRAPQPRGIVVESRCPPSGVAFGASLPYEFLAFYGALLGGFCALLTSLPRHVAA